MKITFFRNTENRVTVSFPRDLRVIKPKERSERVARTIGIIAFAALFVLGLAMGIYLSRSRPDLRSELTLIILWLILLLPIHEGIHALTLCLLKKPVERICFFPYGFFRVNKPSAYVSAGPALFNKKEKITVSAAPMLVSTLLSLGLALAFPRFLMVWTVWCIVGIACGQFDILDIICFLRVPKGALYFSGCWFLPERDRQIRIEYMTVNDEKTTFIYRAFLYRSGKLAEIENPPMTDNARGIKKDFEKQYGELM